LQPARLPLAVEKIGSKGEFQTAKLIENQRYAASKRYPSVVWHAIGFANPQSREGFGKIR
jgi:hypothetical protein